MYVSLAIKPCCYSCVCPFFLYVFAVHVQVMPRRGQKKGLMIANKEVTFSQDGRRA
jgi:hypothetical protein